MPRWIPSWKAIRKNYLINKAADQAEKVKENLQNSQVVKKAAEKVDEVKEKMKNFKKDIKVNNKLKEDFVEEVDLNE